LLLPIAYSYIRFSSTEQLKGDSLRRQSDLSKNYAEANGLELDTKLNLRDLGISAFDKSNLNKGALGQFLKLVEDGMIPRGSYLLVESLDRLSRDKVMDALGIFLNILNAGIIIVTLADNQVYSREKTNDNWASLIMSIVIMSRANEESATKSRRIRASWDNKRQNITKKRFTARCPYWLKPSDGDTGFDLIPERVDVVKRIFQMSIDGIGTATIVKRLNGENVPLFSPKSDGWQTSYIQKVLSNRAVYGELQLNLQRDGVLSAYDVIHDYYPAIMSKEDWLLAASIREGRRSRGGVAKGEGLSNLFSGLLKCGYCGGPMNMSANMKKKANGEIRRTRYVACSKGRRGAGCHFIQWNYDDLENLILQFCQSVDFANVVDGNQSLNLDIDLARKRLTSIDDAIKNKQVSLNNLLSALEAGSNADIPATLLKRISGLEIEIEDLLAEQQAAEKDVIKLNHEQLHSSSQRAATIDLIYLLQTLEGDALRDLRVKLSEAIRRSISHVKLYAGGIWNTEEEIQEVAMSGSLEDGVTLEEALKEVKSHVNTKPNKQARFMTMYFHNGDCRTVARENS
jgi:DNA invertase Pin-like site-specific DNA recombinase